MSGNDDADVGDGEAVSGDDVLGAGREGAHDIHQGMKHHAVAGVARRVDDTGSSVAHYRTVLEQVERLGNVEDVDPVGRERLVHVLETVAMAVDPEVDRVAGGVASGNRGIVDPDRVGDHFEHRVVPAAQ